MNIKNDLMFFKKGFDEVTLIKLKIYENYLEEWLPVPLSGRMHVKSACIYDMFCGPGKDVNGTSGSPLVARKVLYKYTDLIRSSAVKVRLIFNDHESSHIETLKTELGDTVSNQKNEVLAESLYHSQEFDDFYPTILPNLDGHANFIFIDQFGATAIKEDVFKTLSQFKQTDILFFIASDWFRRFTGRPEAKHWNISKEDISSVNYQHIHRFMAEYFKGLVGGNQYYVAPFSLKKGSNIYGLVFACHNPKGIEKFLKVAWSLDPHTGEANYDIDNEGISKDQILLFDTKKVVDYQNELKNKIISREFSSDKDIYLYMLSSGFLNTLHTKPIISEFVKAKSIEFRSIEGKKVQPRFSYPSIKEPRNLAYL